MNLAWTAASIAELRALWDAGDTTAAIGAKMCITKGSVIGKVHRLGLTPRPSPIRCIAIGDGVRKPRSHSKIRAPLVTLVRAPVLPQRPPPPSPPPASAKSPAPIEPLPRVTVFRSLSPRACCWPMWGSGPVPVPAPFCGVPTTGHVRYCAKHAILSRPRES